jgi:AraC family transcriptional regulator of arabinose operon
MKIGFAAPPSPASLHPAAAGELAPTQAANRALGPATRASLLSCGFRTAPGSQFAARRKVDPYYALVWWLRGEGQLVDAAGQVHELVPGVVFQKRAAQPYDLRVAASTAPCTVAWISFNHALAQELARMGFLPLHRAVLQPGLHRPTVRTLRSLTERLGAAPESALPGLLLEALGVLHTVVTLDREHGPPERRGAWIDEACHLLGHDLQAPVDWQVVARTLGLGYERFRKRFREATGLSPGQYRIRRRVEAARRLLESGDAQVKEVAAQLGYANPAAFSTQFRQVLGHPPSHFTPPGPSVRAGRQTPAATP